MPILEFSFFKHADILKPPTFIVSSYVNQDKLKMRALFNKALTT